MKGFVLVPVIILFVAIFAGFTISYINRNVEKNFDSPKDEYSFSLPSFFPAFTSIFTRTATSIPTSTSISVPTPTSTLTLTPTPTSKLTPAPSVTVKPAPTPSPVSVVDANSFREFIFATYGFTEGAQNLIKTNSGIRVKDLSGTCGGGFWIPGEKVIELNCSQHEAAVHELSHVFWHTYRLNNPDTAKGLARDVIRLARGDGSASAIEFANGYVYGIGGWQGMYCTSSGCADINNIQNSDFDLTEQAANARINDWEIYAGFASWTMGKFKDGLHALPGYMWKYFEPQFTGTIQVTPYYSGGHS